MHRDYHIPVMLDEVIEGLNIQKNGIYVDGTAGGGGHCLEIAKRLDENGIIFAIDRDTDAVDTIKSKVNTNNFKCKIKVEKSKFSEFDKIIKRYGINKIDGLLLDLGISSYQIDKEEKGFSYKFLGSPLDMRMDKNEKTDASTLLKKLSEEDLADIFRKFGEIRSSRKIARAIKHSLRDQEINTTGDLIKVIESLGKNFVSYKFLAKIFQALRISVNKELEELEICLTKAEKLINKGGRLVVLTYHSLEDRIVKEFIKYWEKDCICKPEDVMCRCNKRVLFKRVNKKVIRAAESEVKNNPRARSAKLRIAEKIE